MPHVQEIDQQGKPSSQLPTQKCHPAVQTDQKMIQPTPSYLTAYSIIFKVHILSYLTVLYAIKQFIASKSTNPINSPIIALAEKESYFSYISRRCLDCPFFLYYINSNSCASHYQPILTKLQSGMESNTCPETNSPPCSNY